jgi:integral membrane protein
MKKYITTAIGRLRFIAFLEGLSLLLLLFVAMPFKYLLNEPSLVRMVGSAHGGLFILFVILALQIGLEYKWSIKTNILVFLSSFVPFGTFYADHKLFRHLPAEPQ